MNRAASFARSKLPPADPHNERSTKAMISLLVAVLSMPLASCGGAASSQVAPAAVANATTLSGATSELASTFAASIQSAMPIQLMLDVATRVDSTVAGLGGGVRLIGQVAEGFQGDGWMEYVLFAPAPDDYALFLQYAHDAETSLELAVRVNDGPSQRVLLAPSGGRQQFVEAPALAVGLDQGRNLVRLQAVGLTAPNGPSAGAGPAISAVVLQRMQPLSVASSSLGTSSISSTGVQSSAGASADLTGATMPGAPNGSALDTIATAVAATVATQEASAEVLTPTVLSSATTPLGGAAAANPSLSNSTVAALTAAPPVAIAASAPAASSAASPTQTADWGTPLASARIFISGHSLTDNPLGENLVSIANSLGGAQAARYNQQIVIGSGIRYRTDRNANWAGYSRGKNRDSSGLNVVNELRSPKTLGGDRYDTLIIAENHRSLSMLQWENTVRNLRHFHERFIEGNGSGKSYFYETWFDINDKANPTAWIAHERAQSRTWQCVAARVNAALAAEHRADRITPLPAGAALVELIERATQGQVPGITRASTTATVNTLFSDNVHLTPAGVYYMALVSYSAIYRRPPTAAAVPSGISAEAAVSLQQEAWRFVSNFYASYKEPALEACKADVVQNFCEIYWNYRSEPGSIAGCRKFFGGVGVDSPLDFNPATNASYWYPAP
jgi:hypothetical protein